MRGFIKVAVTILAVAALVALIGSLAARSDVRTCESTLADLRDRTLVDEIQRWNLAGADLDAKQREGEVHTAEVIGRCHAERWSDAVFECIDSLPAGYYYGSCLRN